VSVRVLREGERGPSILRTPPRWVNDVTESQLELPIGHGPSRSRLEAAFEEFDRETPHIYEAFCRFTFEAIRAGRERLGAKLIWERIRWFTAIESTPEGEYRLNNNWTAYYARKFMQDHPEHDGLFATRSVVE